MAQSSVNTGSIAPWYPELPMRTATSEETKTGTVSKIAPWSTELPTRTMTAEETKTGTASKKQPEFKRFRFAASFDVLVGTPPNQKRLTLQKDLMSQRSGFFAAAHSGRSSESEFLKPTDLTAEDPQVFSNYINCVSLDRVSIEGLDITEAGTFEENAAIDKYLNEKFGELPPETQVETQGAHRILEHYKGLMKLYLLAKLLLDHKTANMVVDETLRSVNILKSQPGSAAIHLIYDNTTRGDCMRNFWADLYVHNVCYLPVMEEGERPWPNDFLADVVAGLQDHKTIQSHLNTRLAYRIDQYFVTWNPIQGPHRYYSGPGTEGIGGEELIESDEEDLDYEPSDRGSVMRDDEMSDAEMDDTEMDDMKMDDTKMDDTKTNDPEIWD